MQFCRLGTMQNCILAGNDRCHHVTTPAGGQRKEAAVFLKRKIRENEPRLNSINSGLELFEGLSQPEIRQVGGYFTVIDVEEGRDLGRRGTQCQYFGVLLRGQVAMSFHDAPAGILAPGCFWGAVALLAPDHDRRRRGTASALVASRVAVASPREFAGLLYSFPLLAQRIHAVANRRTEFIAAVDQADLDIKAPIALVEYPVHIPLEVRAS